MLDKQLSLQGNTLIKAITHDYVEKLEKIYKMHVPEGMQISFTYDEKKDVFCFKVLKKMNMLKWKTKNIHTGMARLGEEINKYHPWLDN